jgi:hypothetical protein
VPKLGVEDEEDKGREEAVLEFTSDTELCGALKGVEGDERRK